MFYVKVATYSLVKSCLKGVIDLEKDLLSYPSHPLKRAGYLLNHDSILNAMIIIAAPYLRKKIPQLAVCTVSTSLAATPFTEDIVIPCSCT